MHRSLTKNSNDIILNNEQYNLFLFGAAKPTLILNLLNKNNNYHKICVFTDLGERHYFDKYINNNNFHLYDFNLNNLRKIFEYQKLIHNNNTVFDYQPEKLLIILDDVYLNDSEEMNILMKDLLVNGRQYDITLIISFLNEINISFEPNLFDYVIVCGPEYGLNINYLSHRIDNIIDIPQLQNLYSKLSFIDELIIDINNKNVIFHAK